MIKKNIHVPENIGTIFAKFINIEYLISKISCMNIVLQEIDTLIAVAIAILLHTQLSDSGILQFLKKLL